MLSRVFIVEDHPLMRQLTTAFVDKLPGVEVCGTATTAEEALELLADARADLLLVDVSLPGMSGIDFVVELRERPSSPPCLMLSGHAKATYMERALAAGARGYVEKGNPPLLRQAILRVLQEESEEKPSFAPGGGLPPVAASNREDG